VMHCSAKSCGDPGQDEHEEEKIQEDRKADVGPGIFMDPGVQKQARDQAMEIPECDGRKDQKRNPATTPKLDDSGQDQTGGCDEQKAEDHSQHHRRHAHRSGNDIRIGVVGNVAQSDVEHGFTIPMKGQGAPSREGSENKTCSAAQSGDPTGHCDIRQSRKRVQGAQEREAHAGRMADGPAERKIKTLLTR